MTPSSSPFQDALYGQAADADSHAAASALVTSASVAVTTTTTPPLQPSPRKLGTSSMPLIMTRSAGNSAQGSPDHDQHANITTPQPRARGHQEQQQHLPMASLAASEPPRSRSLHPTPLLILEPLLQAEKTSAESSFVHWVEGGQEAPGEPSSLQWISSPRNRSPAVTPKVDDVSGTASASRVMSHGALGVVWLLFEGVLFAALQTQHARGTKASQFIQNMHSNFDRGSIQGARLVTQGGQSDVLVAMTPCNPPPSHPQAWQGPVIRCGPSTPTA